ncbi:hypothetical protein ASZ78_011685, partial [Callipepla squamata]
FPVYDYELPVTEEALNASLQRINSQSWGPNLYGVVRSHVRHVDMWNSNYYRLELQLSVRETECTKASGRDPFTCDFRAGPYVPTAVCKSVVEVSSEQIVNVIVRCHQSTFSSESMSSEEMMHMLMTDPIKRGNSRSEGHLCEEEKKTEGHLFAQVTSSFFYCVGVLLTGKVNAEKNELDSMQDSCTSPYSIFVSEAFSSRGRGRSSGNWHKPNYTNPGKME